MVKKWWNKTPEKFPDIELGEYQIMPNHFHAIVINVGADPCVGPENHTIPAKGKENKYPVSNSIMVTDPRAGTEEKSEPSNQGEHMGSPLHRVIQWFKTMVTNEYIRNVKYNGWKPFDDKIWQRNYYEHIIRNERAFQKISKYIRDNPANWNDDEFFM